MSYSADLGSRRTRRVLIATACALAAAGCGGDASDGPPQSAVPECDAAGINERVGRQGTCVIGDVKRTVVNRHGRLVLDDEIELRLEHLSVRARGNGRMVGASLRVRNLGSRPLRWPASPRQVALWVGRRLISQDPHGHRLALQAVRPPGRSKVALAPGKASTAAVGWRLSPAAAAALDRRGSAIIVVPPRGGGPWVDAAVRIGVLRLWK